jgi:hypothetical protein
MSYRKWFGRVPAVALSAAIALAMPTVRPLVAVADGDGEDVKVVQKFLTIAFPYANQGDCDPSFRPVPPNPTCVLGVTITGTSGLPSPPVANTLYMTTLTPYLNENSDMFRADGSVLYTDFTDYNVSITGHGIGTFTQLETQASVKADGTQTSLNCVVEGSQTGDLVGMTGCGTLTASPSDPFGTVVWHLHFPGKHHYR